MTDDRTDVAASVADLLGLASNPLLFFAVLVAVALAAYLAIRFLLVPLLNRLMERSVTRWDDILVGKGVLFWLALLGPALILFLGAGYAPQHLEIWRRIILVLIVIIGTGFVDRLLSAALEIYGLYPFSRNRPIKALIQILKLAVYVAAALAVVAVLAGTSLLTVLGGVTAITAVLLVVFKDTLLSLIANIQVYANDLVRQGDWIQVHDFGADGIVSDISLHTVKVRNWDNTLVTVPTCKLVEGSFQNWRSMSESGGRRIRRALLIDQTSVRFCDREMLERFWRIRRLRPYLESKQKELESRNTPSNCDETMQSPLNSRKLTNLGTFRAYVLAYLNESPHLHDDMTVMVRQRPPTPNGIPLEVYVFSKATSLVEYEGVQADVFDHLLAALPFFDLRLFQYPTGENLQALKDWLEAETPA